MVVPTHKDMFALPASLFVNRASTKDKSAEIAVAALLSWNSCGQSFVEAKTETIAKTLGWSKRKAIEVLKRLERNGYITIERRPPSTSYYHLSWLSHLSPPSTLPAALPTTPLQSPTTPPTTPSPNTELQNLSSPTDQQPASVPNPLTIEDRLITNEEGIKKLSSTMKRSFEAILDKLPELIATSNAVLANNLREEIEIMFQKRDNQKIPSQ